MTVDLAQWRCNQHPETKTQADYALEAFLAETSLEAALLDYAPHTAIEIRHLARTRRAA